MSRREKESLENTPPRESTTKPIIDRCTTTASQSSGHLSSLNSTTCRSFQMGTYPDDDHFMNTRHNGNESDYRRRFSPRPDDHRTERSLQSKRKKEEHAATVIQSNIRGYLARKQSHLGQPGSTNGHNRVEPRRQRSPINEVTIPPIGRSTPSNSLSLLSALQSLR